MTRSSDRFTRRTAPAGGPAKTHTVYGWMPDEPGGPAWRQVAPDCTEQEARRALNAVKSQAARGQAVSTEYVVALIGSRLAPPAADGVVLVEAPPTAVAQVVAPPGPGFPSAPWRLNVVTGQLAVETWDGWHVLTLHPAPAPHEITLLGAVGITKRGQDVDAVTGDGWVDAEPPRPLA